MKIGFVGAGAVARSIARRAVAAGHEVLIASASGQTARTLAEELGARASAVPAARVALADLVILATRWPQVGDALGDIDGSGCILFDATNPFSSFIPLVLADLDGQSSSVLVARQAPGARVVNAFNSTPMSTLDQETERGGARPVIFMSGDDPAAKARVTEFIESMGLAALDLGSLHEGGLMQQAGGLLAGPELFLAR